MIAEPLRRVLEATGYLSNRQPAAPSVTLAGSETGHWMPSFAPDAWWRSSAEPNLWGGTSTSFTVYFKFVDNPTEMGVAAWQREIWNRGFAPLLWIVSPERIEIYNGFGVPQSLSSARENLLATFALLDEELARLDTLAGRLAMETGQFWRLAPNVSRENSVAGRLLRDLSRVERDLVDADLDRDRAQALIGRSIFAQYLVDRTIVTERELMEQCGHRTLPEVFFHRDATGRLFDWLRVTFNGDMFPPAGEDLPRVDHLARVARFLRADDTESGQLSLFPYRFDVIPVGLISSIYEQFVHSAATSSAHGETIATARADDIYYTPLAAVSLVLDEVFAGLTGAERVLDLTCGSGAFLVEALARLVYLKSGGDAPRRETVRDTLYNQVYGVDISEAAVRIAAFSLYLAALELDPNPRLTHLLTFRPLVGKTLLVGDAHSIEDTEDGAAALITTTGLKKFDVIVGNPPWTFKGKARTVVRRARALGAPLAPRAESLDFVTRAISFAHANTRFGMILSATPFFSRSATGLAAVRQLVEDLSPVTLINLSNLSGWLFRKANMPAVALLARHRLGRTDEITLVQTHWSQSGERCHTIEISPSDVTSLPIASWRRNVGLLKASLLGRRHDLLLLDELSEKYQPLEARLVELNTQLSSGLQLGTSGHGDAGFLVGLPFVQRRTLGRFAVPGDLPAFALRRVHRARHRRIYRAPLVLVQENLHGGQPRPLVAIADRDVVYTEAYMGAPFAETQSDIAYLTAGILSSSVAPWYLLMAGASFGLWKRRLKRSDIAAMPMPDLKRAVESEQGMRIVKLVHSFREGPNDAPDWESLDHAVFDLYELDDSERVVVEDGLLRASWQWKAGRLASTSPAGPRDRERYARAFLSTVDTWMSVSNRRRMRAEIYEMEPDAPIGVIRFALEDVPGPSVVRFVSADRGLNSVLSRIGERTKVQIAKQLVGVRELRVHAENEVSIIKPSTLRHWLGVCGLQDADAVLRDSIRGSGA